MDLTTTGFPFGNFPAGGVPMGAGRGSAIPQGFALALGAAGIKGFPRMGAGAANDLIPAFANEAAPTKAGVNPFIVTQGTPSVTLAQLLAAAGSKIPSVDMAEVAQAPNPMAAKGEAQVPATAAAQPAVAQPAATQPATAAPAPLPTGTDMPASAKEPAQPLVAEKPEPGATAEPQPSGGKAVPKPTAEAATTVAAGTSQPLPTPGTEDQPGPASTLRGNAAAPQQQAATPVKSRKAVAIDREGPALPADPQPRQPDAAPAIIAGTLPQPAQQVATPDRKAEPGRSGKATAMVSVQPQVQAGAAAPAFGPEKQADAPSGDTPSFQDAALPADAAPHAEPRGAGTAPAPQQSFAAQVAQSTAQAHAPAPALAAAPSADPMVPARAGQLGHALGVEIARKVEAGENTLRVRMNPAELGRVEVTLAFDDSGRLHATMRAESHHALELLRQDAPDLGRALDSAGIRTDTQSFRFESRGDGNGGASGQPGQQQSRGQGQQAFHEEPETPVPAYRPIRGDGQVDLLA